MTILGNPAPSYEQLPEDQRVPVVDTPTLPPWNPSAFSDPLYPPVEASSKFRRSSGPQLHRKSVWNRLQLMLTFFGVSLIFMFAHHFFNWRLDTRVVVGGGYWDLRNTLNNKPSHLSQEAALQIGNVLAFFATTFLSLAVGIAFVQCAWWSVRRQSLPLHGISSLWSAGSGFSSFFSRVAWGGATLAMVVAVVAQAVSFMSVFPPSSLTTHSASLDSVEMVSVPTLDLSSPRTKLYDVISGSSYAYFGPLTSTTRTARAAVIGGTSAAPVSPCGACSYGIDFSAPALRCEPGFPNVTITDPYINQTGSQGIMWTGLDFDDGAGLVGWFGTFGGNFAANWTLDGPGGTDVASVTCYLYNSTYTVTSNFRFADSMSHTVSYLTYDTPYPFGYDAMNTLTKNIPLTTPENVSPAGISLANTIAIKDAIYSNLVAVLYSRSTATSGSRFLSVPENLNVLTSPLVTSISGVQVTWAANVSSVLEQFFQNVTLSFLAQASSFGSTVRVGAIIEGTELLFVYTPRILWIPYGVGILVAGLACVAGYLAMASNGHGGDDGFAAFLDATRSHTLQNDDGSVDENMRVRYVPLKEEGSQSGAWGFVRVG